MTAMIRIIAAVTWNDIILLTHIDYYINFPNGSYLVDLYSLYNCLSVSIFLPISVFICYTEVGSVEYEQAGITPNDVMFYVSLCNDQNFADATQPHYRLRLSLWIKP